ncbi:protein tramtrack, beta isoform isoform X12 [Frankliniella occidentalis]|uniref:Protein tramtrack, beta isoform isoform X11 n=1 Tax=Frankliniella occidentalis TaxID=133901 RepID=A0A6J1SSG9_FRAOC|nr:protein tramtrack, beta isoform isoform X11 [Frankliniella occidentalis]XP_052127058.1 protein tramtrack, beta isoform isoform X12 [Frankliniella occidentalis]
MTAIDAEQFSLRWNNFHNNLTAGFHDLLLGEDLVDVTIAAEGKFVQAHKMVLSVCSPYFKDLFKVNPCKHPIVILKDTGYKELEALLQFMYRGEVNVRQEELAMFLKTAEMLQIKGLTGSDSKKESAEPTSNKTSSNSAPSRTHSLPQDTSTHPPPKRKRSEAPPLPSTSAPTTPSQVVDVTPQTPPEGPSNDQALQDGNDFMNMMNPKMEPQEYDESEDGLDMMADDSVGHDPLVQQLLGGDPKGMAGLGNFVGLPGMKDGNVGQDGGQVLFGDSLRMVVDTGEGLVCPVCQKRFTRRDNLKSHFSNLHGEHRGPFRCSFCFKVTKNKMSLRAHMKNYHPNKMQRRNSGANNSDNPIKLDDSPLPLAVSMSVPPPAPSPLTLQ